jgi:hypothetical protein
MSHRRLWQFGGFAAGGLLILFGVATIVIGANGYRTVQDELGRENISGSDDMNPSSIKESAQMAGLDESVSLPTCDIAGEEVDSGANARCFAQYMRIHALEATGGLTYAEMGRYQSSEDPRDPAGTDDPAAAEKNSSGQPVSNDARNIWITFNALATALNVSYMAQQLSIFSIVVGVALLLTGIGLVILALAVFGRERREEAAAKAAVPATG